MKTILITIVALLQAAVALTQTTNMNSKDNTVLTYLALGDSYTIGEMVAADQSYPNQVAAILNKKGQHINAPTIIAKTGWRTDELIQAISDANLTQKFDIVTLLIGVNNQYQNKDTAIYRTQFIKLLKTSITFAKDNTHHVFVLSVPDWGVTPFANGRNLEKIAAEIDAYNRINKEESKKVGANYINITSFYRDMGDDPAYLAEDKLHPSGKMYEKWAKLLANAIEGQLKKE
ncbi:MAG TPA: SGNH/GDSL hydrolase family protein [Mucilaginibacter sp.]|nr:SGNH/GDSL hydrolase family protein [Mucilaginibacter sp.]